MRLKKFGLTAVPKLNVFGLKRIQNFQDNPRLSLAIPKPEKTSS